MISIEIKENFWDINDKLDEIKKTSLSILQNAKNIDKLGKNIDVKFYEKNVMEILNLTKILQKENLKEFKK